MIIFIINMTLVTVKRKTLVLLAGIVWSLTGFILISVAFAWLWLYHLHLFDPIFLGVAAGILIHRFGFSRIAQNNLDRINTLSEGREKICIFAFQNKRSYFTIVIMILAGYGLRHSFIPKIYLVPLYIGIGLALLCSSQYYYRNFL